MMDKLVDATKEEQAAHEAEWGGYNDFPPEWEELSPAEFAMSHLDGGVVHRTEHRQMYPRKEDGKKDLHAGMTSATLYFLSDNTGWALSTDYWAGYYETQGKDPANYVTAKNAEARPVRFYRFGCKHDDKHVRQIGRYAHEYKCGKCGRLNVIDSGD